LAATAPQKTMWAMEMTMSLYRNMDRAALDAAYNNSAAVADSAAMMAAWADHDNISCVHPMGASLQGRRAIAESWQQIFKNRRAFHVLIEPLYHHDAGTVSVRTVRESFLTDDNRQAGTPIIATNIYRQDGSGWRMIAHHASPAPHAQDPSRHAATTQMH